MRTRKHKTYQQVRQETDKILADVHSGKVEIRPYHPRGCVTLTTSETKRFKELMGVCPNCNDAVGHEGPCK